MIRKITTVANFIFLLGFIIFSFQSCVSARDKSIKEWERHEWKLVKVERKEEPTWKIHKRKLRGTNFLEYKIEGNVPLSPEACLAAFKRDINKLTNGAENKKYPTYEISDESEDGFLTYVIHDEPFPFKDTEMSVRYQFINNHDGSSGVKWNEAWEESEIKISKKLKRVDTFRGSWDFSPITLNTSKALYSVRFDPKGMPLWLVTPMVSKFLKNGLEDIRTTTSK